MITYLKNIRYGLLKIPQLGKTSADSNLSLISSNFSKLFINTGKKYYTGSNTKVKGSGRIMIQDCLDIGITGLHDVYENDATIVSCDGELIVNGHASIGKGSRIHIGKDARLVIGTNSYITGRATITVNKGLSIGNDCALAWNITIIDNDYHELSDEAGHPKQSSLPISIGDRVWIGCNVTILKGVNIPGNVVVAANSVVTKSIEEPNVLVAGNPARIVKRNISWKR